MAIDTRSNQALDVLLGIVQTQASKSEREKDRGQRLAEMRIQTDFRAEQNELNRLSNYRNQLMGVLERMEKQFNQSAGTLRGLDRLNKETGITTGDARSIVGKHMQVLAGDSQGLRDQIAGISTDIEKLSYASREFQSGKAAAVSVFDKYRKGISKGTLEEQASVGPKELEKFYKDLGGTPDPYWRAGLENQLMGMVSQKHRDLIQEALLGERIAARQGQAESAFISGLNDEYQIEQDNIEATFRAMKKPMIMSLPAVPGSAKEWQSALGIIGANMAKLIQDNKDLYINPRRMFKGLNQDIDKLTNEWKDAWKKRDVNRYQALGMTLMERIISDPDMLDNLDAHSDEERAAIGAMMRGYNVLKARYQSLPFSGKGDIDSIVDQIGQELGLLGASELSGATTPEGGKPAHPGALPNLSGILDFIESGRQFYEAAAPDATRPDMGNLFFPPPPSERPNLTITPEVEQSLEQLRNLFFKEKKNIPRYYDENLNKGK
jgi:hypothetical protein